MLVDYLHVHTNVTIRYHASNMIIIFESESAYFVLPKARSSAAAWYIIINNPSKHSKTTNNSPVHIMCNTIKNVMYSAAEAKTGGIFVSIQCACPIRLTLIDLGHKQPPTSTPLYTDNSTAKGILTSYMRQKISKAFDMLLYWVKDRI